MALPARPAHSRLLSPFSSCVRTQLGDVVQGAVASARDSDARVRHAACALLAEMGIDFKPQLFHAPFRDTVLPTLLRCMVRTSSLCLPRFCLVGQHRFSARS